MSAQLAAHAHLSRVARTQQLATNAIAAVVSDCWT